MMAQLQDRVIFNENTGIVLKAIPAENVRSYPKTWAMLQLQMHITHTETSIIVHIKSPFEGFQRKHMNLPR